MILPSMILPKTESLSSCPPFSCPTFLPLRRHIIAIVAIGFLAAAVLFHYRPIGEWELDACCLRTGAVIAVLWLAYPDLMRLPPWLLAMVPVLLIILAKWPKLFLLLVPLLIVLALLKPRWGGKRG